VGAIFSQRRRRGRRRPENACDRQPMPRDYQVKAHSAADVGTRPLRRANGEVRCLGSCGFKNCACACSALLGAWVVIVVELEIAGPGAIAHGRSQRWKMVEARPDGLD
jgi:hypothetical protein